MASDNMNLVGISAEQDKGQSGLLQVFPDLFAIWCFLLFVPPLVKTVYLVDDPVISFWMSDYVKVVVVVPVAFIAIGHFIHQRRRAPSKGAVILSLVGSSLALAFVANRIAVKALVLGDRFAATDCDVLAEKHELQVSWQAARDYYATCEPESSNSLRLVNVSAAVRDYTIQSCAGYEEESAKHPAWGVLEHLEVEYECGGWCETRKPLWSLGERRDSCSIAVSQVFSDRIMQQAIEVAVYSVAVLTLTAVSLILLGPSLRDRGLEW